jgi:multidrug resistance efflux pump
MTNKNVKLFATGAVVLIAAAIVVVKYWYYLTNPWTRDGQVHAQVIQIAPRISGPIVSLPIVDNQLVKAGDVLFEIDPRTFKAAVKKAEADMQQAQVEAKDAKEEADRARKIRKRDRGAMSQQQLERKVNDQSAAEAAVLASQAQLEQAQLNLEFTQVKAPVDGYVTNLNLRLGSQAVANQPALALIDINSYWIHGYFREDRIGDVKTGNRAIVTLMSYPDRPLEGGVDSLGWGIAQDDGSTGYNLLPNINATFEWIRLAQRVPVRVHLVDPPKDIPLRVGTTASVMVMTGDDSSMAEPVPPLPRALQ